MSIRSKFAEEALQRRLWNNSVGRLSKVRDCSWAAQSFINFTMKRNREMIEELKTDDELTRLLGY